MSESKKVHPCLSCGACCASFRVSFHNREIQNGGLWKVPVDRTEEGGSTWLSMKGTNKKHRPACTALSGEIGKSVKCEIYEHRPSPCRNFLASYEDGRHRSRCDEARRKHGLRPLGREAFRDLEIEILPPCG
jgi:Fe-S-cluster containining protein